MTIKQRLKKSVKISIWICASFFIIVILAIILTLLFSKGDEGVAIIGCLMFPYYFALGYLTIGHLFILALLTYFIGTFIISYLFLGIHEYIKQRSRSKK